MKPSEILGTLSNVVSSITDGKKDNAVNVYPEKKRYLKIEVPLTPEELAAKQELPLDKMVPPLQQKIELLKRAVDIDNVFDGTSVDKNVDHTVDYNKVLRSITKNAGISPKTVAIMVLSDDDPLDQ